MERKLSAILAADVVGYSKLMTEDEEATLSQLKAHRFDLFDPKIAEHNGRIIKLIGDGTLVEFASVVDAVKCAIEIQSALADAGGAIRLRIGINIGDVIVDGDDIYGEGVNIAARLETLAKPGGICISDIVHQSVRAKLHATFIDMGEQSLKNIDLPVQTWQWPEFLADSDGIVGSAPENLIEKPSIAVLPFTNMSGDAEQEYFSDGLTEDIITELSRFRSLAVIARSSTFAYKGHAVDVGEVGRKLNVNYLVEGSVRRAGSRVRVTAQLIEVETGAHLWADRYDRSLEDIFAVQDDLVASIVARLGLNLNDVATIRSKNRPTEVLGAYDYLLRARSAWWRGRINEAFEFVHRSVEADPTFAAAQAYLSLQYAYQSFGSTAGLTKEKIAEKARFHAEAALHLDDTDPFVHASASMAFGFSPMPNKERGFKHINIAVSLNPHDWELMFLRAWQLSFMGQPQDALDVLDKFRALNPLGGFMVSECLADTYYMMGEYEKSLHSYKDQTDAPPQALPVFAACHAQLGRVDEAKACLAELERIKPEGFEVAAFAETQIAVCAREEDQENWRKGFRLAGVDV